jgi:hypothetical protein
MGASQLVEGIAVFIQYAGGARRVVPFGCQIEIARVVHVLLREALHASGTRHTPSNSKSMRLSGYVLAVAVAVIVMQHRSALP